MERLVYFGIRKRPFFFTLLNLPLVGGLYGNLYIEFPYRGGTSGRFFWGGQNLGYLILIKINTFTHLLHDNIGEGVTPQTECECDAEDPQSICVK